MGQPKIILIVDDDPDLVETTKIMLQSGGYDVMSAASRTQAMEQIRQRVPDLILLDVIMGTDAAGFDLSYELRGNPEYARIPIIMLTGISRTTGIDFGKDKGTDYIPAEGFLDKPVHPQKLLAKVAEVLGQAE